MSARPGRCRRTRGFSLVEILVVVLIIALMTGVAVLSLSLNSTHPVRDRAEHLAQLLRLAGEEASMQGENLALGFWQRGWHFYVLRAGTAWQPLDGDELLKSETLPEGYALTLILQGQQVQLEAQDKTKPQVFLLASGEMEPFELVMSGAGYHSERITGNAIGEVKVQRVEGEGP